MANQTYPSFSESQKLWDEGLEYRKNNDVPTLDKSLELFIEYLDDLRSMDSFFPFDNCDTHSMAVATNAMTIASRLPHLNPRKAYILGLLHDYGERYSRRQKGAFHGTSGYDALMELGYPEAARICLTHSFPNPDINPSEYTYPIAAITRAKELISNIVYDDYDRLIQYSDLLVCIYRTVSIAERTSFIQKKYNVSDAAIARLTNEGLKLKDYFDAKCGCNTYDLLGIKE